MKHTIYSYILGLCMLASNSGCTTEDNYLPADTDKDIQISACIETSAYTRMQTGTAGNEAFQKSDRISLQITAMDLPDASADTHTLELTEQGWKPALSWQDFPSKSFRFTAFYPTLPDQQTDSFVHTVATDQRETERYGQSDLLMATTTVQRKEAVKLSFQHLMSLVEVQLTSNQTFTAEELAQATVQINIVPSISIDSRQGSLGTVNSEVQTITFGGGKEAIFHAIVPPQLIQEAWRKEWISICIGSETFTYAAPKQLNNGTDFQALQSGQRLTLKLKLEKKSPVDDFANQTVWTYGLKEMPDPSEWNYADVAHADKPYPLAGLKWDPKYGWYDCNKSNPSAGSGGDSNMCWAAASANMLYWWLEQDKEYVKRFGYQGPHEYVGDGGNKAIFAHYKKHFPNKGGNVYEALDWFLTGREVSKEEKTTADTKTENGYFSQVLGEKKKIAERHPTGDITITEVLKKAFRNKEAIACNLLFPGGYLHAINIWGAKFDAQGELTHIYITDNNDSDYETQSEGFEFVGRFKTRAGILEKAVQHKNGRTYMESSNPGDFSMQIIQVCTLGLMQKEWEAYFAAHP